MRWFRTDLLGKVVAPLPRLVAALGFLAAQAATQSLGTASVLLTISLILALLAGKKISLGYFLILALSIVGFSLLSPFGKVLVGWGPLRITQGALEEGALRALRLIGMVFTSVAAIHRDLQLPGRLGSFWAEVLGYYQRLLEARHRIRPARWIDSLDEIFLEVLPADSLEEKGVVPKLNSEPVQNRGWWSVPLVWGLAAALFFGLGQ